MSLHAAVWSAATSRGRGLLPRVFRPVPRGNSFSAEKISYGWLPSGTDVIVHFRRIKIDFAASVVEWDDGGHRPSSSRTQDRPMQLRVNADFLALLDSWRLQQPDAPSRTEAIRHFGKYSYCGRQQERQKVTDAILDFPATSPQPANTRKLVHMWISADLATVIDSFRNREPDTPSRNDHTQARTLGLGR